MAHIQKLNQCGLRDFKSPKASELTSYLPLPPDTLGVELHVTEL